MKLFKLYTVLVVGIFVQSVIAQDDREYLQDILSDFSSDVSIADCINDFTTSYEELQTNSLEPDVKRRVDGYNSLTLGELPELSEAAYHLQNYYIVENPEGYRSKYLLDEATDNSNWSDVHSECHEKIREKILELDKRDLLFDLFLTNSDGDIVYTFFKGSELGLNASDSNFFAEGTSLALFEAITDDPTPEKIVINEYKFALNTEACFTGTSLGVDKGKIILRVNNFSEFCEQ